MNNINVYLGGKTAKNVFQRLIFSAYPTKKSRLFLKMMPEIMKKIDRMMLSSGSFFKCKKKSQSYLS